MRQTLKTIEKKILENTIYLCRCCGKWGHLEQMVDNIHCRLCKDLPPTNKCEFWPVKISNGKQDTCW